MKQKVVSQAPGKLILLGEYAVLEGAPALVMAVDRFARVTVQPCKADNFLVSAPVLSIRSLPFRMEANGQVKFAPGVSPNALSNLNFFSAALEITARVLKAEGLALRPAEILLVTEDFFLKDNRAKLGLGYSATLTVTMVRTLLDYVCNIIGRPQSTIR